MTILEAVETGLGIFIIMVFLGAGLIVIGFMSSLLARWLDEHD